MSNVSYTSSEYPGSMWDSGVPCVCSGSDRSHRQLTWMHVSDPVPGLAWCSWLFHRSGVSGNGLRNRAPGMRALVCGEMKATSSISDRPFPEIVTIRSIGLGGGECSGNGESTTEGSFVGHMIMFVV